MRAASRLVQFVIIANLVIIAVVGAQTKLVATEDAYVQGGINSTNTYGVSDVNLLRVRGSASTEDNRRGTFIKFDLNSIVGAVTSAKLKLTVNRAVNDKVKLDRADFYTIQDDSWSETTICWSNAPARGMYLFSKQFMRKSLAMRDTTYYLDITQYVNEELLGDKILTIFAYDDSLNGTDLRIASKDATPDSSRPMLFVETGSTAVEQILQSPKVFSVAQNYPNPFNPETTIRLEFAVTSSVTAEVYDLLGHRIKTLASGIIGSGSHRITWRGDTETGEPAPAGVYFARIHAGGQVKMIKMLLVK